MKRPPVVAILGHVDHGKTTLLDRIRETNLAAREVGNITQSIGAYQVSISYEKEERKITFIDTPGHEAFLAMRSRGVSAADIAILVVAANEGVKPQTKESIKHIKEAKIPLVVALTKSDLPNIDPTRIKQELAEEEVLLEGFGGNVPSVLISAKAGRGIKELLNLILLVWDMQESKVDLNEKLEAVVIESRLDPKRGIVVTLVIKSGKLAVGDEVFAGGEQARVRAIYDDRQQSLKEVFVGEAVEILGFSSLPELGELVVEEKKGTQKAALLEKRPEEGILVIVLKTNTLGTLEAIVSLLPEEIFVVAKGSGEINESDILLAKIERAIVVGFNVKTRAEVLKLARTEGIIIKEYRLIYELLDELKEEVAQSLKSGTVKVAILGKATVLASFPYDKTKVLGVRVIEGRFALGDKVKLIREEAQELGISTIKSLRKGKEGLKVVQKGGECGLILDPLLDFNIGDMLLSYRI